MISEEVVFIIILYKISLLLNPFIPKERNNNRNNKNFSEKNGESQIKRKGQICLLLSQ